MPNSGAAYPDIIHGDQRYVVGVPDQPFEVRVTAPFSQFTSGLVRALLKVDDRCVGVSSILSPQKPCAKFTGFVSTVSGQNLTRQFLFGKAETSTSAFAQTPSQASKTGGIEVKLVVVNEVPGYNAPPQAQAQPGSASFKAVEGNSTAHTHSDITETNSLHALAPSLGAFSNLCQFRA